MDKESKLDFIIVSEDLKVRCEQIKTETSDHDILIGEIGVDHDTGYDKENVLKPRRLP